MRKCKVNVDYRLYLFNSFMPSIDILHAIGISDTKSKMEKVIIITLRQLHILSL